MKQSKDPAQNPAPQERQYPPTEIAVKIHPIRTSGPVLANASVDLNGCFAIRGVKVMSGSNGPFVSMPRYKLGDEYKDVCFPCTKEARQQFNDAVLNAYEQSLRQAQQPDNAPAAEQVM